MRPKRNAKAQPPVSKGNDLVFFRIAMRIAGVGQVVAFVLLFLAVVATPVSAKLLGGLCGADAVWRLSLMAGMLALTRCWVAGFIAQAGTPSSTTAAEAATPLAGRGKWYRFGLLCLFLISVHAFTSGIRQPAHWGLISGHDQPQYFAFLHSWVFDRDLSFQNEYDRIAQPNAGLIDTTGSAPKAMNVAPIGTPVLWLPFYLLSHAAVHILRWFGLNSPADGLSSPYATGVAFGNLVLVWLGMHLVWSTVRRCTSERAAFLSVVLLWLATPLMWYLIDEAWMSHGASFFACSLVLYLWSSHPRERAVRGWAALGAAVGLAALVRPSECVLLLAPLIDFVFQLRTNRLSALRGFSLALLCFVGVFSLQLFTWYRMSGLSGPEGAQFRWNQPEIGLLLFSTRHGLFAWHPVAWLGVLGVPLLWRYSARVAITAGAILLASIYMNACLADWWAGVSFGARRLIAVLPFMALGMAASGSWVVRFVQRRPWIFATAGIVAFALYNQMLLIQFREHWIHPGHAMFFQRVWSMGAMIFHARFGHPFSYPANWLFAAKHGTGPAQYDYLAAAKPDEVNFDVAGAELQPFLGEGWEGLSPRWYTATPFIIAERPYCTLLLPLLRGLKYQVSLQLAAPPDLGVTQEVSVSLNGTELGEITLDRASATNVEFALPGNHVRGGLNTVGLNFSEITDTAFAQSNAERGRLLVETAHGRPCGAFLSRLTVRRAD